MRKCRMCSCTDNDACDPPCSWVPSDGGPLCSTCASLLRALDRWLECAHEPTDGALFRELRARGLFRELFRELLARDRDKARMTVGSSKPGGAARP